MRRLSLQNMPSTKEEGWKYTNLERAVPKGLVHAPKEDEILIHRNCGQNGGNTVEVLLKSYEGKYQNPRIRVILEEGAQMTLIENHEGIGAYWNNVEVEIDLAQKAQLNHYRIFEDGEQSISTITTEIKQSSSSSYNAFYVMNGCGLMRNEVRSVLVGKGAQCNVRGVNLLKGSAHGDTLLIVEHKAPHCNSSQFFRSVLADHARGIYQGKVLVHEGAQETNASQLSNAILLSEKAEMDAKPELEIYNDDVVCSHGATTGQISEEALFYMRSRGLSESQAHRLLIEAFVDEMVDKLEDNVFKTYVEERVGKWLRKVL